MKDELPVHTTRFIKQSCDRRIFVIAAIHNRRSQEVERLGLAEATRFLQSSKE